MARVYNWKRFWCPREGSYGLFDGGYLPDPESSFLRGDVRAFVDIAATPCLILLGEPGIGKTFAIESERRAIEQDVTNRGERILWPNLQAVDSSSGLSRAVIETSAFEEWKNGGATLHLYLDALDECMLRVQILGKLLTTSIEGGPVERLHIRLTCRTAEWRNEIEQDLVRILGKSRVAAYELVPLRRRDVAEAVRANELNEKDFFHYVDDVGLVALAIRPVSLNFLLRCFRRNELPRTQTEAYELGCRELCEESEHRSESGLARTYSADQRLAVAKRIAAASIFSGRPTLLNGREDDETPADAIRIEELVGGEDRALGETFCVTPDVVKEAFDTGLFTSRGAKILGWAHHTYAEYLAARYIADSGLSLPQILSLVVHPDDPERKITPQLHQLTAWLAVLLSDVFTYVLEHEPELLLRSDAVFDDYSQRARLVDRLILLERTRNLARIDPMEFGRFRKLSHPGLADQLRPIITDTNASDHLRGFAIDIAEYTSTTSLAPELVRIALDDQEPLDVRTQAVAAVVKIGSEDDRRLLKPLTRLEARTAGERRLVRLAIRAAWPSALTARELFEILSPSRRGRGLVTDDYFIAESVIESFDDATLPDALDWVRRRVTAVAPDEMRSIGDSLDRLEDFIVNRAWERLGTDGIARRLGEICYEKLRRHERVLLRTAIPPFQERLDGDPDRRRTLTAELITALAKAKDPEASWILFGQERFLSIDDLAWLLERSAVEEEREAALYADIALRLADLRVPAVFEQVTEASKRSEALRNAIDPLIRPVALDSADAQRMRRTHTEHIEFLERRNRPDEPKNDVLPAPTLVRQWLERVEREPELFWVLSRVLAVDEKTDDDDVFQLDITKMPGWRDAEEDTRLRIIDAAERYLSSGDPQMEQHFGTPTFTHSAVGGVRALTLLKTSAPDRFARVPVDVWRKWIVAILSAPNNEENIPLLKDAYEHVPDEIVRRIQQLIEAEITRPGEGRLHVLHKLSDCWDERLTRGILDVVRSDQLKPEAVDTVVQAVLENAPSAGREFASSFLANIPESGERRDIAVRVAVALLHKVTNESWDVVWPTITGDRPFGRKVISDLADEDRFAGHVASKLTESRIADLYIWLCDEFPPEDDPVHEEEEVFSPSTRDNIVSFRSTLLFALRDRGTSEACDQMRRLARQLPGQEFLPRLVVEAEVNRRSKTWQPVSEKNLRSLITDRSRRLVRTEPELVELLLDSLQRLQVRAQGELPSAMAVWNAVSEDRRRIYTPKDENDITDYIARHLRDDLPGVILAREVKIRRGGSSGSSEFTDLHVDAIVEVGRDVRQVSAIIETKGCWNRRILEDMKDQLVDRYLAANDRTRSGIYLAAWFYCDAWDDADYRKNDCAKDRSLLREELEDQARKLGATGYDIRAVVLDLTLR